MSDQVLANVYSNEGTLVGAAVPITFPWRTRKFVVTNDSTLNSLEVTLVGQVLTLKPTDVSVAQGAAGTTVLAAASGSNKHKVIGCVLIMDAAGTLKFNDGTVDLSGAMSLAANGGFVLPTSILPFTETAAVNRPLNLITATGKASGVVAILTEP